MSRSVMIGEPGPDLEYDASKRDGPTDVEDQQRVVHGKSDGAGIRDRRGSRLRIWRQGQVGTRQSVRDVPAQASARGRGPLNGTSCPMSWATHSMVKTMLVARKAEVADMEAVPWPGPRPAARTDGCRYSGFRQVCHAGLLQVPWPQVSWIHWVRWPACVPNASSRYSSAGAGFRVPRNDLQGLLQLLGRTELHDLRTCV